MNDTWVYPDRTEQYRHLQNTALFLYSEILDIGHWKKFSTLSQLALLSITVNSLYLRLL